MEKRPNTLLVMICLILAIAGLIVVVRFYLSKPFPGQTGEVKENQTFPKVFADVEPGPKTTTVLAPNGKMSLVIKEETAEGTVTEKFSVMNQDGGSPVEIYSETLSKGVEISVPYNTFSPDNKYIFLKKVAPSGTIYFVLRTDGKTFADGSKAIDFVSLFNEKYPDTPAADVTGWGGMTLIVVNTRKPDGTIERSYWYDVASNSFIGLSTRFN